MALSNAAKETAALAIAGMGGWVSLHTADPGTTGTGEVTGGSPAYARKQTTWTGGASDGIATGSEVTIDVPAVTVTHFGVWSAVTGGTFIGGGELLAASGPPTPSPITFGAQGQCKVTPTLTQT